MKIINNSILKFDKKLNKIRYYFPIRCENDKPYTEFIKELETLIKNKKNEN